MKENKDILKRLLTLRIARFLHRRYLHSRLSPEEFLGSFERYENSGRSKSYAAVDIHSSWLDLKEGTLIYTDSGPVLQHTGEKIPCRPDTGFEREDFAEGETLFFSTDINGSDKYADIVISRALCTSLCATGAHQLKPALKAAFECGEGASVFRLFTDDNALLWFLRHLGCRYYQGLIGEDIPDPRLEKSVLLAEAVGLVSFRLTDPFDFNSSALKSSLLFALLSAKELPLPSHVATMEELMLRYFPLKDIAPCLSVSELYRYAVMYLAEGKYNNYYMMDLLREEHFPDDFIRSTLVKVMTSDYDAFQLNSLIDPCRNLAQLQKCILENFYASPETAGLGQMAGIVMVNQEVSAKRTPIETAWEMISDEDSTIRLLGFYMLDVYAWMRWLGIPVVLEIDCDITVPEAVTEKLLALLQDCNSPFYPFYAQVARDMVLAEYLPQERLMHKDILSAAFDAANRAPEVHDGWDILASLPLSSEMILLGRSKLSAAVRQEAYRCYRDGLKSLKPNDFCFAVCAVSGYWPENQFREEYLALCLSKNSDPSTVRIRINPDFCLLVRSARKLCPTASPVLAPKDCEPLPEPYSHMPPSSGECDAFYQEALALQNDPNRFYAPETQEKLMEAINFVRGVCDCGYLPKYRDYDMKIAVLLLLRCKPRSKLTSSYAVFTLMDFLAKYGNPEAACAFAKEYREFLCRPVTMTAELKEIPMDWQDEKPIVQYVDSLFCLDRIRYIAAQAKRCGRNKTAEALLAVASEFSDEDDDTEAYHLQQYRFAVDSSAPPWDRPEAKAAKARAHGFWEQERKTLSRFFSEATLHYFYDDPGFLLTALVDDPTVAPAVFSLGYSDHYEMVKRAVRRNGAMLRYASDRLQEDPQLQWLATNSSSNLQAAEARAKAEAEAASKTSSDGTTTLVLDFF